MEYVIFVVKYAALAVVGVNVVLLGRALIAIALEKARATQAAPATQE